MIVYTDEWRIDTYPPEWLSFTAKCPHCTVMNTRRTLDYQDGEVKHICSSCNQKFTVRLNPE